MEIRKIFRRNEITLNRIHHTVTVMENGERLKLYINEDPVRIVTGLNKAQKKINETIRNGEPTEDEIKETAEFFANVLLGKEQTKALFEFYAQDAACVMNVCGKIFREQLAAKMTKAQKQMG